MNGLYMKEHKHKVGKDGWTIEDNLRHREEYSPPILENIKEELQKIRNDSSLPPSSELAAAAVYMENEWKAIEGIFKRGDTELDNNKVERGITVIFPYPEETRCFSAAMRVPEERPYYIPLHSHAKCMKLTSLNI